MDIDRINEREYRRMWRLFNASHVASRQKSYRQKNLESARQYGKDYMREWRARHRKHYLKWRSEYRKHNHDKICEQKRAGYWKDVERSRLIARKNRKANPKTKVRDKIKKALRRAAYYRASLEDMKKIRLIYHRAQELRRWFKVSVDHIIPLSKGGAHAPRNLQIIYSSENMKKRARSDYIPSVIFK
jgi:5-methylcytosine-specific restriction endonuclease McrA